MWYSQLPIEDAIIPWELSLQELKYSARNNHDTIAADVFLCWAVGSPLTVVVVAIFIIQEMSHTHTQHEA